MGTEKRERQKANREQRHHDEARAARASGVKRNVLRWSVGIVVAIAAVVFIAWIGGAFDSDDEGDVATIDDSTPTDTTPVETTPTDTTPDTTNPDLGPTECAPADGSAEKQQEFNEYPPMCIDEAKAYSADMVTNFGDLTIELFADRAPLTVNSFVNLTRYHYFDDTQCHRAIPSFVVQCGDPTATGTGGPGYRFEDELPEEGEYIVGSVAMANSGPDTNGSQFFLITGENGVALPPNFTLFGQVTDGLDTTLVDLDAVSNPDNNGVPPLEEIIIESVTITES